MVNSSLKKLDNTTKKSDTYSIETKHTNGINIMTTQLQKLAVKIESEINAVIETSFSDGMDEYRDELFVRGNGFSFTIIDQGVDGMGFHFVDSSNLDDALSSTKKAIDENWFPVKTFDLSDMI